MSISLLINSFINNELKFNHFKVTFSEISEKFDQVHIKIRGRYKDECIAFAKTNCKEKIFTYQDLKDDDWLNTTYLIVSKIESKNIFLYNEDHKLYCSSNTFTKVIFDIEKHDIDYMCYSFFKASKLSKHNILPLKPFQGELINYFIINKDNLNLIGRISPNYFHISLISIFSKKYIIEILKKQNFGYKIYIPVLSKLISRLFSKRRRFFYKYINLILNKINTNLYLYPINTPFNFEKMWFENINFKKSFRYAIPNKELFINFDDDNGMYLESLIKRGLYPFDDKFFLNHLEKRKDLLAKFKLNLKNGEKYDCTFFSSISRINICPVLVIKIIYGEIDIKTKNDNLVLRDKDYIYLYSNLSPVIEAKKNSELEISIFDEIAK